MSATITIDQMAELQGLALHLRNRLGVVPDSPRQVQRLVTSLRVELPHFFADSGPAEMALWCAVLASVHTAVQTLAGDPAQREKALRFVHEFMSEKGTP